MFRVVRICISMHDSCIRFLEVRMRIRIGHRIFPSHSSKLGVVSRELTHSPAPPTLPDHPSLGKRIEGSLARSLGVPKRNSIHVIHQC